MVPRAVALATLLIARADAFTHCATRSQPCRAPTFSSSSSSPVVPHGAVWRGQSRLGHRVVVKAAALADSTDDEAAVSVPSFPPAATPLPRLFGVPLRYLSLSLLVLQSSIVAVMAAASRRTRVPGSPLYLGSVAVLLSELVKLPVCVGLIVREKGSVRGMVEEVREKVVVQWTDTLRMGVPALCYCLQNALFFVAISSLSATSYQLWSQSKTLFTALFFVTMLGKVLSKQQWLALGLLSAGVGLVQTSDAPVAVATVAAGSPAALVGITAVLASSVLSGFANVYFERVVKQSSVSLWVRNVQLGLFSIPQAAALMLADRALISSQGPLIGFTPLVWGVVLLKAFGGLLVAGVVKYADNVLKTYATAIAIILTCIITTITTHVAPSVGFIQGMMLVISSIFLYNFGAAKLIPIPGCSPANLVRDKGVSSQEDAPPATDDK